MKILLFVDPTFRGDWAVSPALDLVAGLGGPLTLLTTDRNRDADPGLLERTAEKFAGIAGLAIDKKSRPGLAREAIIAETTERRPALAIVPPAGRGKLSRMIRGSRVKAVVHGAPATVMVARKPVSEHIRRILVPIGERTLSESTVRGAQEIAKALQATVTLLHVAAVESISFGGVDRVPSSDDFTDLLEILSREGIQAQLQVREGLVGREVLTECNNGHWDLIILGNHLSWRENGERLAADLAEDIVMACPIPVLVVRTQRQAASAGAES